MDFYSVPTVSGPRTLRTKLVNTMSDGLSGVCARLRSCSREDQVLLEPLNQTYRRQSLLSFLVKPSPGTMRLI